MPLTVDEPDSLLELLLKGKAPTIDSGIAFRLDGDLECNDVSNVDSEVETESVALMSIDWATVPAPTVGQPPRPRSARVCNAGRQRRAIAGGFPDARQCALH